MSDYPLTRLGDVATEVSRRTIVEDDSEYDLLGAHWYAKGLYVKDRKSGKSIKAKYLYEVKEGDFVYNRLFGWKGAFAVATSKHEGCFVSGEFPGFKINSEKLLTRYLWYFFSLEAVWDVINAMSRGSTPTSRKRFQQDVFLKWEIPLPPLSEQKKIVAVLDLISETIVNTKDSINHISSIKQGLMQRLLTRGFGHTRFKKTKIGEIPESWKVVKLGNPSVTSIVGGTTPSRDIPSYWGGKIPWATPTDVTALDSSEIAETKDMITENGMKESSVKLLPVGSVLMTSRATIGYCAINTVPMTTNQGFASFICTEKIHNKFLLYLLESIRGKLERYASGSTFKEISKSILRSMLIQLPPINEQQRITEILDALDSHIRLEKCQETNLEQLKKGLMQVLLTGKVRVKV